MLTGRPYPVRALYASGVNIVVSYPNTRRTIEALRSLEFVAVAAHAIRRRRIRRLVLPKTTTLEEEEVSSCRGPDGAVHARRRAAAGRGALGDRHRRAGARKMARARPSSEICCLALPREFST